ncbi:hypothetical protein P691DRAFT_762085 [Macrolepiota fuliginosa MF-IS2]|uniref:Uncharacterized protein n=1 Tax=Macrolepiota fuliginosa MF-IS2 TaxID=1400762 RepID=A0A9P5X9R0_9AGAR|nr:hypothetical protein P691DRAFT_762085 [Macrolepiota fuliginosa MF-IS2]
MLPPITTPVFRHSPTTPAVSLPPSAHRLSPAIHPPSPSRCLPIVPLPPSAHLSPSTHCLLLTDCPCYPHLVADAALSCHITPPLINYPAMSRLSCLAQYFLHVVCTPQ